MNEARTIRVKAPAKLNLTFAVKGLLPGGFHAVETLMQAVSLFDFLEFRIKAAQQNKIEIVSNKDGFPLDESNLIAKAFRLFLNAADLSCAICLQVKVEKNIPIAAGLAGGSSNAAATLLALNAYVKNKLSPEKLDILARSLGADVPFCLHGGLAVGAGKGDELSPAESTCSMNFLVVKPRNLSLSTAWVYQKFDQFSHADSPEIAPDTQACANSLGQGNLPLAVASFGNVFEPLIFSYHPELASLSKKISAAGCYTQLTGSGPALFAVCEQMAPLELAQKALAGEDVDTFLCQSLNHGVQICSEE